MSETRQAGARYASQIEILLVADVFDFDRLNGHLARFLIVYPFVLLQREEYNYDEKNASDRKSDYSKHLTRRSDWMRSAKYTARSPANAYSSARLGKICQSGRMQLRYRLPLRYGWLESRYI